MGRDLAVSEEHELLDHEHSFSALLAHDTNRLAFFIESKLYFVIAEIYCALLLALLAHDARKRAHDPQFSE